MNEAPRRRFFAYLIAILAPAVSLLMRWPLWSVLEDRLPVMTFLPGVALAAYYGGLRPGLFATALSASAAVFFIWATDSTFLSFTHFAVSFSLFVLTGAMFSILSESLHRTQRRLLANERLRADQALREAEERFRQMAENIQEIFWLFDVSENRVMYVSPGYETVWGRPCQSLYGQPRSWSENVHPDDRARAIECMKDYRRGLFSELEFRVIQPAGSIRWIRSRAFPMDKQSGQIRRIAGLAEDITARKRTEEALRASEHRWRSLTEALPQLVWTATPDGACDYFSTQWTQHTGVPENELLGWQWLETLHPQDREPTRQAWLTAVHGPSTYDVEYRVRHANGEYHWFKTRGVPIRDACGSIYKWFGTCTDITNGKKAAEELRVAKEAAESANRAKDEFLANVSHEIRTPMNAILGMTELVLETSLLDDQRQSLVTVKAAADNLLTIINDLLDFSKIEAGKLVLDPADFSLRSMLNDALRTLAMRAHKKGLELLSHVQPDVPDLMIGDSGRLRQVLLNLVGNAIKFTTEGDVIVRVQCATVAAASSRRIESSSDLAHDDEIKLQFSVTDTGIGIPHDKHDVIFRAFEQEDTSTTRKYGGTGLGLTIASRLAALMGGTISVESEPGRGSTFTFTATFRRQTQSSATISPQPPVLFHDLPVLIVDDNETNQHILKEWLHGWHMKPTAVGDGAAAMDALSQALKTHQPFALVLLDARMPDTDGLTLAAMIREQSSLSSTRLILLTSGDRPNDAIRSHNLGIDARILKPVPQEELLESIYRVMSRTDGNGATATVSVPIQQPMPVPDPATDSIRILVAEDNEFNVQLLEQLLLRRGHRVTVANNGREALQLAEEKCFDLVLLDIHMPEMDGFEVIRKIRERERNSVKHLPVIALTARSAQEVREKCLAAGMDDYLSKPIQSTDLWGAIDRVVRPHSTVDRCPDHLLDKRVLLAACGGDNAILKRICETFQARLPEHLQAIQGALREKGAAQLREAAHKFCGMVGTFSTVAGDVASDLEDLAAQGQFEQAGPLVERLAIMAQDLVCLANDLSIDLLTNPDYHAG